MELISVGIVNFGAIGSAYIDFRNKGLTLIEGVNKDTEASQSNGAGKSTCHIESVIYALYGRTLKEVSGDDIVNRTEGKNTAVILTFSVGDLVCRVERYRKHKKFKNKVLFFINEEDHTQASVKATDKLIQDTIGIDFTTFINSVVFGQGDVKLFSQATDKERKQILEGLANLGIYNKAEVLAKDAVKELESSMQELMTKGQLLQRDLDNISYTEKSEKEQYEQFKKQFSGYEDKIKDLKEKVQKYTADNREKLHTVDEEISEKKRQLSAQETPKKLAYEAIQTKVNECYRRLTQNNSTCRQLENKIADMKSNYDNLSQFKICPVCGQEMDKEHTDKEKMKLAKTLQDTISKYLACTKQAQDERTQYDSLVQQQNSLKVAAQEEEKSYRGLYSKIQELSTIKSDIVSTFNQLEMELESAESAYERFKSVPVPKPKSKERNAIKEQQDALNEDKSNLLKDIDEYKQVVSLYSNSGVKSHVLDLITPFLNERANNYLAKLSGSGMSVIFNTQKKNKDGSVSDKFDIEVNNETGGDSYAACSQGEKRRIDLAISLAIQDLLLSKSRLKTNVVFYDECFDGLDAVGCERVIELLKERTKTIGSIFVITHNDSLKALFDNVVTVVKEHGMSFIEGEE